MDSINPQAPAVYNKMIEWHNQHEQNFVENLAKPFDTQEPLTEAQENEIVNNYYQKMDEIGSVFNFMEGKDPSDEIQYKEQLSKLAEGSMLKYDLNGDNQVSTSEYLAVESINATDDEKALVKAYSYLMFQIMDGGMGNSDGNGTLSQTEFESYFKNLDKFSGDEQNVSFGEADGKIDVWSDAMDIALVDNMFNEETFNKTLELFNK